MKSKERERAEWFRLVAQAVIRVLAEMGASDWSRVRFSSLADRDEILRRTIEHIRQSGVEYADSKANRIALSNFISLWPEGESNINTVIGTIRERAQSESMKLPEKKDQTQLEAVVKYLAGEADRLSCRYNLKLWLPVLPENMYLDDIKMFKDAYAVDKAWRRNPGDKWDLSAVIGIYDDPENQSQLPLSVDFANNGHHAVCGMVVSGKSTFMQTLIYSLICKYSPQHLNVYLLDFSSHMLSPFEAAPHCGGVVYDQDLDKTAKFFSMLTSEMNRRKALLGGGDYSQYVRSGNCTIPAWVVAIDNYASFREKTNNEYDDIMLRLSKEGIGYGIYLVITGGGFGLSEIPGRVGDNIRTVISLEMGDKFKYMDILRTTGISTLPEVGIKGRGLANVDGGILEFHTALAVKAEDDFAKSRILTEKCEEMAEIWDGPRARKIPEIPQNFTYSVLEEIEGFKEATEDVSCLPYALREDDASVYSVDLSKTYCYTISGKSRVGKTNTLKVLMMSAHASGGKISVFEKGISELKKTAEQIGANYITTDRENFDFWSGIKDEFIRRNKLKRSLINDGCNEAEIYDVMKKEQPMFLFISDITAFMESVYRPEAGVGEMKGFVENVMDKGSLHNIFIFACINNDNVGLASTYEAYKSFVGYKTGIHLGGNISAQRIFTFQNIPYAEQSKVMKKGIGLVPTAEDDTVSERIVVPVI